MHTCAPVENLRSTNKKTVNVIHINTKFGFAHIKKVFMRLK